MVIHDGDGVWVSDINKQIFLRFYIFFCFSLKVLVLIEKVYETFKTVFYHISKHFKNYQIYSATSVVF